MNDFVKTVFVKGEDGKPLRINESDFDAEKHERADMEGKLELAPPAPNLDVANGGGDRPVLLGEPRMPVNMAGVTTEIGNEPAASSPAEAPIAPQPQAQSESLLVTKEGKKYVVINSAGQKVTEGFEADGYADEKKAWDAIMSRNAPK